MPPGLRGTHRLRPWRRICLETGIRAWRRERKEDSFREQDSGSQVIVPHNGTGRRFQETAGPARGECTLVVKRKVLEPARLQF